MRVKPFWLVILLILMAGIIFLLTYKFKKEPVKQVEGVKPKVTSKVDKNTTYGYDFSALEVKSFEENKTEEVVEKSEIQTKAEIEQEKKEKKEPLFPKVDFFGLDLVEQLIDFLLNNYDFKQDKFTFSLKKLNLTFGTELDYFNISEKNISQKRLKVFKKLLNNDFYNKIFPILKEYVVYRLDKKVDSFFKQNKIDVKKKSYFYGRLQKKLLALAFTIEKAIKDKKVFKSLEEYMLIQSNLKDIYAKYWQLQEKDSEEKVKLGNLIKQSILARERVQNKILTLIKSEGLDNGDKLYLLFWTYRRLEQDAFKPEEVLLLADMLKKIADRIKEKE